MQISGFSVSISFHIEYLLLIVTRFYWSLSHHTSLLHLWSGLIWHFHHWSGSHIILLHLRLSHLHWHHLRLSHLHLLHLRHSHSRWWTHSHLRLRHSHWHHLRWSHCHAIHHRRRRYCSIHHRSARYASSLIHGIHLQFIILKLSSNLRLAKFDLGLLNLSCRLIFLLHDTKNCSLVAKNLVFKAHGYLVVIRDSIFL